MPPATASRRSPGWKPNQHGAWFMLALPVVVGLILRPADASTPWVTLPLVGCWFTGYLAFNAATVWLKAPAPLRGRHRAPLATYAALAATLGLATLAGAGVQLLGWLVIFAPLTAAALWLASRRRERTVIGGALTVAAAALMTLVVRFLTPRALFSAWGTPDADLAVAMTAVVFAYLFGTVLFVKTMIRERGRAGWLAASVGWHLACTALAATAAARGGLSWVWTWFFAATAVRAWLLPALGRTRRIPPLTVGLVEIGFTTAFVVATLVQPT